MKDFLIQNYDKLIGGLVVFGGIIWAWFKAIQKTKSDLKITRIEEYEVDRNLTDIFLKQNPDFKNENFDGDSELNSLNPEVQKIKAKIEHLESVNKVLTFWKLKK